MDQAERNLVLQVKECAAAITAHMINSMPAEAGRGACRAIEAGAMTVHLEVLMSPSVRRVRCRFMSAGEEVSQWERPIDGKLRFLPQPEPGLDN